MCYVSSHHVCVLVKKLALLYECADHQAVVSWIENICISRGAMKYCITGHISSLTINLTKETQMILQFGVILTNSITYTIMR